MSRLASFWRSVEGRTVSKALLKSRAITTTYGCSARRLAIVWRRNTIAAVVEPVAQDT